MSRNLQRALLALVLAGAIALIFLYRDRLDAATLEGWVAGAGVAGPLLFMALYAIAIVCRTDRRSAKAAAVLAQRGFARVQVARGGMTAWLERGWPVERDATRTQ